MTFLAPGLGIIAGSLGLLGVLISYFLKLRRRPIRVASTMLWERAVQDLQVNAPFRWLRASWLLLLQLLVVACVALALARPVIEGDGPVADRVILIVDTSASMSAADATDGRTRFEAARDGAIERIAKLPRTSRVMIIAGAGNARTVMGFTRDHAAARAALHGLEPTDQPGDLRQAMRVVAAFAQSSGEEGQSGLPALYIYTDGADAPPGGLSVPVPEQNARIERVGPEPGASVDNAGVGAVAARRDFEDPSAVRLFARIVSARSEPSEALVRLLVDGEPIEAKRVVLPGRSDTGAPGEAPVTFELRDSDGALAVVSIAGDDALAADNQAGIVLAPPAAPRILVVQPGTDMSVSEALLIEAFAAAGTTTVERTDLETYIQGASDGAYDARFDVLVFDGVQPAEVPSTPSVSLLEGAGDAWPVRDTPRPLANEVDLVARTRNFSFWSRSHPVMRFVTLGDIVLTLARAGYTPPTDPGTRAEALASIDDLTTIGTIVRGGVRRIVVAFRLGQSNWARDASFPVFIANCVDWLTQSSAREAATSATTARPASLFIDNLPGGVEVRLDGPADIERTATSDPTGRVVFGVLPKAGLYTARWAGGQSTIAVNLSSAEESALRTSDAPLIGGGFAPMGDGIASAGTIEIWRWFIIGAAALLALEWALYAWKMRL